MGPTDGSAVQKEYDFVFDDAIDFIKSGIIGGEGDFETAEIAKEKEVKVGLIMWEELWGGGPEGTCDLDRRSRGGRAVTRQRKGGGRRLGGSARPLLLLVPPFPLSNGLTRVIFFFPPPPHSQERAERSKNEHERLQLERAALPVFPYREAFLKAVEEHQVVIIVAETGAGGGEGPGG